jgi:small subunit ribosomal protein S19
MLNYNKKIRFCDSVTLYKNSNLKIFSRNSVILENHLGKTFQIHVGNKFVSLLVTSRMVGHKFGEFCLTRKQFSHKKKKKKK